MGLYILYIACLKDLQQLTSTDLAVHGSFRVALEVAALEQYAGTWLAQAAAANVGRDRGIGRRQAVVSSKLENVRAM